jgi:hypothetical protein
LPKAHEQARISATNIRSHAMPIQSKYIFIAAMDVDADKAALFAEVYDTEHIPFLLKVPGVRSATRMQGMPFGLSIGGETVRKEHVGPTYYAVYEIDSPDVLKSDGWTAAVEKGRWPTEVRPYCRNRQHMMMKVL